MTSLHKADLGWSAEAIGLVVAVIFIALAVFNFLATSLLAGFTNLVIAYMVIITVSTLAGHKYQALAGALSGILLAVLFYSYVNSPEGMPPIVVVSGGTFWCFSTAWLVMLYGHSLGIFFTDFRSSEQSN